MKVNSRVLINYMFRNNLTELEFCERCGICRRTLKRLIKERMSCNIKTVYKIKTALKMELAQLIKK